MAEIRMTPEQLIDKSKGYGRSADTIDSMLEDLRRLQGELRDQWSGEAFTQFDNQFIELEPKVMEFSDLMKQIELQLTKTAEAVQEQDQALARNFGLR
ncbi:WXG100 family type VII secretion target [Oceanobacillus sp. CFH 90083]|uniref:WXG100 family type VII secretion target n=1 Tax=Oceanobacillus sp. CFH 90083 TaxID=2592336 RepID=UPI00128D2E68|nr:WXG100 family type VII secretion target [Oceanobacillus sp. CFH 90083]